MISCASDQAGKINELVPVIGKPYASKEIHHAHASRTQAYENPLGSWRKRGFRHGDGDRSRNRVGLQLVLTTIRILEKKATSATGKKAARSSTVHV